MNDIKDLEKLDKAFDKLMKKFPEKKKELIKTEGNKLYNKVLENIERDTNEYTGNLKEGVTLAFGSKGGYAAVRPNAKIAPHTHLVENGHQMETKDGIKWVEGKHMYRNALEALEDEIVEDTEDMIEEAFKDFG